MREMGAGRTEQILDKTTEQLGVDSSLNQRKIQLSRVPTLSNPENLKHSLVLGMVQTLCK